MEAVLAIALAGNILQFLQAAGSVLSKAQQLYRSIDGILIEHADSKRIAQDLKRRSTQISQAVDGIPAPELCRVCNECASIASELVPVLEKLQVKGKHSRSQSIRKAIEGVLRSDQIFKLEKRLSKCREQLVLHIILSNGDDINKLTRRQGEEFRSLTDLERSNFDELLKAIEDQQQITTVNLSTHAKQLKADISSDATKEGDRIRSSILTGIYESEARNQHLGIQHTERLETRIGEQSDTVRAEIISALEIKHEILSQKIQSLENVMLRKHEELKEIILAASAARDETKRKTLQSMGHSVTVLLRSLQDLYQDLKDMLGSVLNQAKTLLEPALYRAFVKDSYNPSSAKPQVLSHSPSEAQVLTMYYHYYYDRLFSRHISSTTLNYDFETLAFNLGKASVGRSDITDRAALVMLAKERDSLLWFMTTIVAVLDCLMLSGSDVQAVISCAFNVLHDRGFKQEAGHAPNIPLFDSSAHERLMAIFQSTGSNADYPDIKSRFSPDTTAGNRLLEDIRGWHHIGTASNLTPALRTYMIRGLKLDDGKLYADPSNLGPAIKAGLVQVLVSLFGLGGDVALKKSWDLKRPVQNSESRQSMLSYKRIVEINGDEPVLWVFAQTIVAAGVRCSFWDEVDQRKPQAQPRNMCPSPLADPAIHIAPRVTLPAATWSDGPELSNKSLSACEHIHLNSKLPLSQQSRAITLDMDLKMWWQESDEVTDAFWADIDGFTKRSVR